MFYYNLGGEQKIIFEIEKKIFLFKNRVYVKLFIMYITLLCTDIKLSI